MGLKRALKQIPPSLHSDYNNKERDRNHLVQEVFRRIQPFRSHVTLRRDLYRFHRASRITLVIKSDITNRRVRIFCGDSMSRGGIRPAMDANGLLLIIGLLTTTTCLRVFFRLPFFFVCTINVLKDETFSRAFFSSSLSCASTLKIWKASTPLVQSKHL